MRSWKGAARRQLGRLHGVAWSLALAWTILASGVAAAALPDDRRYELVSPSDKRGGDVLLENSRSRAASSGDALQFASLVGFADVQGMAVSTDYISRRSESGWLTHGITPRQDPLSGFLVFQGPGEAIFEGEFSENLSTGVVRANAFPQGDSDVSTVQNLFVTRSALTPGAGEFELVTDSVAPIPPFPLTPRSYKPAFAAASDDFRHVTFESSRNLTQETIDAGLPTSAGDHKLYEWVDGIVRYVGFLPDEEGGGLARAVAGRGTIAFPTSYVHDTISDDGSRIFFTVPETGQLYMRENGTTTIRINRSESTAPNPSPAVAEFRAATPDGSHVFFTSEEPLEDGDSGGNDLWRWDADAPLGSRLTRLSVDQVPGDDHTPPVLGVLGVSDDGETAYFIARGPLLSGLPASVDASQTVIYRWRSGTLRLVGLLDRQTLREEIDNGQAGWLGGAKVSRVTADGEHALWITREGNQLSLYDHGSCGGVPCEEIYVFSATANGGAGRAVCVSCNPRGGPATAPSRFVTHEAVGGALRSSHMPRPLTEDGRFVFFHTTQQLLDEDRNDRFDVYEYDLVDDKMSLLSTGRADADDSFFMDSGTLGEDVFFATRERLVGWDVDNSYDIYDARIGGGFPEPVSPASPCVGRTCQGASNLAPVAVVEPGSSVFRGSGNVEGKSKKAARRCRRGKVRKRVRGRVQCVRRPIRSGARRIGKGR